MKIETFTILTETEREFLVIINENLYNVTPVEWYAINESIKSIDDSIKFHTTEIKTNEKT